MNVSIIVPLYNSEKYIIKTLKSIVSQNYENKEIIVVDDGSTDSSGIKVQKMANEFKEIKYIYQDNKGAPAARNKGLEHSTGEYILFFDSDDIMLPDSISNLILGSDNGSKDIIIGDFLTMTDSEEIISESSEKHQKLYSEINKLKNKEKRLKAISDLPPVPSNKMYRKSFLDSHKLKFASLKIGQDLNFFIMSIGFYPEVNMIKDAVFSYRIHSNSISTTYNESIADIVNVFKKIDNHNLPFFNMNKDILNTLKFKNLSLQLAKVPKISNHLQRVKVYNILKTELNKIPLSQINLDLMGNKPHVKFFIIKIITKSRVVYTSNVLSRIIKKS